MSGEVESGESVGSDEPGSGLPGPVKYMSAETVAAISRTRSLVTSTKGVSDVIARGQIAGEEPTMVSTGNLGLRVGKDYACALEDAPFAGAPTGGLPAGEFTVPRGALCQSQGRRRLVEVFSSWPPAPSKRFGKWRGVAGRFDCIRSEHQSCGERELNWHARDVNWLQEQRREQQEDCQFTGSNPNQDPG